MVEPNPHHSPVAMAVLGYGREELLGHCKL